MDAAALQKKLKVARTILYNLDRRDPIRPSPEANELRNKLRMFESELRAREVATAFLAAHEATLQHLGTVADLALATSNELQAEHSAAWPAWSECAEIEADPRSILGRDLPMKMSELANHLAEAADFTKSVRRQFGHEDLFRRLSDLLSDAMAAAAEAAKLDLDELISKG